MSEKMPSAKRTPFFGSSVGSNLDPNPLPVFSPVTVFLVEGLTVGEKLLKGFHDPFCVGGIDARKPEFRAAFTQLLGSESDYLLDVGADI